jgi:hypothetical protein
MRHSIVTIFFVTLFTFSCQKEQLIPTNGYEEVTLIVPGCFGKPLFMKQDSTNLEPINLQDFVTQPTNGKKYFIRYKRNYGVTYCLAGSLIEIIKLYE